MSNEKDPSARLRWARLRFSIIGPLLSAPAESGDLSARISELAARTWRHPTTSEALHFSGKSIERWYYTAPLPQASTPLQVFFLGSIATAKRLYIKAIGWRATHAELLANDTTPLETRFVVREEKTAVSRFF